MKRKVPRNDRLRDRMAAEAAEMLSRCVWRDDAVSVLFAAQRDVERRLGDPGAVDDLGGLVVAIDQYCVDDMLTDEGRDLLCWDIDCAITADRPNYAEDLS